MEFHPVPMNGAYAREIAGWGFESFYSFYDLRNWPEDLAEWMDPKNWEWVRAVLDSDGELVGEFSFTAREDGLEIGLTMRPDLTGQGRGADFVKAAARVARTISPDSDLIIRVWALNHRAIRAYESAGFAVVGREGVLLDGMPFTFLRMMSRL